MRAVGVDEEVLRSYELPGTGRVHLYVGYYRSQHDNQYRGSEDEFAMRSLFVGAEPYVAWGRVSLALDVHATYQISQDIVDRGHHEGWESEPSIGGGILFGYEF